MFNTIRVTSRLATVAAAGLIALAATTFGASAGNWPDSNANERDHVTGFLCLTSGCDFVRLPGTKCVCKKENPGEQNLSRLKLTCSISVGFQWQAGPVLPPFGN